VVPFPSATFVIGSSTECDVQFTAAQVQPRHAAVEIDAQGHVRLKDLTGSGLMWVNGQPSKDAEILPGTFICLGRLELVVRQSGRTGPAGTMAAPTPLRSMTVPPDDMTLRPNSPRPDVTVRQPTPLGTNFPPPSGKQAAMTASQSGPLPLRTSSAPRVSGVGGQPAPAFALPLEPGIVINGRYRILAKLAAGGMGEVYRAEHVELGKPFAVKVMRPELSGDLSSSPVSSVKRLLPVALGNTTSSTSRLRAD
jgi:predicted component of type VI protein secretion system